MEIEWLMQQQAATIGRFLDEQRAATEQLLASHRQVLLNRCFSLNGVARQERNTFSLEDRKGLGASVQVCMSSPMLESSDDGSEESEESIDDIMVVHESSRLVAENRVQEIFLPVLENRFFLRLVTAMVLANSVLIGLTANLEMTDALEKASINATGTSLSVNVQIFGWSLAQQLEFCYKVADVLLVAYGVELLVRLLGEQVQFFIGPHRGWNIFESIVFLGCLLDKVSHSFNTSWLRGLRILRLFRAVRLVRNFKIFRELRVMLFSTIACLQALMWAFLLLFGAFYIFALYLLFVAIEYLTRDADAAEVEADVLVSLNDDWNGVLPSIVSLLYSCTGGADWSDLVEPFFKMSVTSGIMYILFVLFVTLGLLNVLIALFVDRTRELHQWDREIAVLDQIRRRQDADKELDALFMTMTKSADYITVDELKKAAKNKYLHAYFTRLNIDLQGGLEAFTLEAGADQILSKEQFLNACNRLQATAQPGLLASVMRDNKHLLQKVEELQSGASPH